MAAEITPEEYMTVELIKKQLNLDQYTDKQIAEIRDSFRKSADRMLAYVKKKETAKHGEGGWTKDRYLKILSDLAVLDKTLQTSLVDKTLDAGKAAFVSELKAFEDVLSVKGLSPGFEFIKLHPETLEAYLKQTDIGGAVLKDWTEKAFTKEIRDKIRLEIMSDAILGESYQAIESRLKKAYSGIDKTLIESIVRTHIQSVNNAALEAVAEKNKAVIKNVRWLATLDTRCCMICGALDGNIYPIKSHPTIPKHPRCRCIMVNVVKSWDELGVDVTSEKVKKKIRPDNFKEGVPAKTDKSFAEKFEEFTEKEKKDFIGAGRYKYLKDGKLEFKDLVNPKTGELYKVADLDKAVAAKLLRLERQKQSEKIVDRLIEKVKAEEITKAAQVEKAKALKADMVIKKAEELKSAKEKQYLVEKMIKDAPEIPNELISKLVSDTAKDGLERSVVLDSDGNTLTKMAIGNNTAVEGYETILNEKGADLALVHTHTDKISLSTDDIKTLFDYKGVKSQTAIMPDETTQTAIKLTDDNSKTITQFMDDVFVNEKEKIIDMLDYGIITKSEAKQLIEEVRNTVLLALQNDSYISILDNTDELTSTSTLKQTSDEKLATLNKPPLI